MTELKRSEGSYSLPGSMFDSEPSIKLPEHKYHGSMRESISSSASFINTSTTDGANSVP